MAKDLYVELKERVSGLVDSFFDEENTSKQRKDLIREIEKFPDHLSGALFGIFGHDYKFEINGKSYTLQYTTTYIKEVFKSMYWINLYAGQGEQKELIRQECIKGKSAAYIKFLKLVDAVKDGRFNIDSF